MFLVSSRLDKLYNLVKNSAEEYAALKSIGYDTVDFLRRKVLNRFKKDKVNKEEYNYFNELWMDITDGSRIGKLGRFPSFVRD